MPRWRRRSSSSIYLRKTSRKFSKPSSSGPISEISSLMRRKPTNFSSHESESISPVPNPFRVTAKVLQPLRREVRRLLLPTVKPPLLNRHYHQNQPFPRYLSLPSLKKLLKPNFGFCFYRRDKLSAF